LVDESVAFRLIGDVDFGGHRATEFAGHALGLSPVDIGDY
jgi:hypothetical protein